MDKNHPCLIFSRNMVDARKGDNHDKPKVVDTIADDTIKYVGCKMLSKKIETIIKNKKQAK